jgi:hypothetical protein
MAMHHSTTELGAAMVGLKLVTSIFWFIVLIWCSMSLFPFLLELAHILKAS